MTVMLGRLDTVAHDVYMTLTSTPRRDDPYFVQLSRVET
jgi:hypothetical protein